MIKAFCLISKQKSTELAINAFFHLQLESTLGSVEIAHAKLYFHCRKP